MIILVDIINFLIIIFLINQLHQNQDYTWKVRINFFNFLKILTSKSSNLTFSSRIPQSSIILSTDWFIIGGPQNIIQYLQVVHVYLSIGQLQIVYKTSKTITFGSLISFFSIQLSSSFISERTK